MKYTTILIGAISIAALYVLYSFINKTDRKEIKTGLLSKKQLKKLYNAVKL